MNGDIYEVYCEFLSGKKLDVARRFRNLSVNTIVDRIEYLRKRCVGKKVLHVGCLDHPNIILSKMSRKTWLHGIILEASEYCIGIDIDPTAYEIVSKELNVENIRLLDLAKPLKDKDFSCLRAVRWDIILCPEVLEHITNHQQFLQNLYRLSHCGTTLIITGPNAFHFANFINTLRGFEAVNSDHKYWFTFYTLSRMLATHGWEPRRLAYYHSSEERKLWQRILGRSARRLARAFSNGLIIEASYADKSPSEEAN
jgi:2-polyprenyl-3-methyl-5-hydroxy-6-metoxy-1,4-benzoquinol methylase